MLKILLVRQENNLDRNLDSHSRVAHRQLRLRLEHSREVSNLSQNQLRKNKK
jgi:hypothetical protein